MMDIHEHEPSRVAKVNGKSNGRVTYKIDGKVALARYWNWSRLIGLEKFLPRGKYTAKRIDYYL